MGRYRHTKRAFCRQVVTSSGSLAEMVGLVEALPSQMRGDGTSVMVKY